MSTNAESRSTRSLSPPWWLLGNWRSKGRWAAQSNEWRVSHERLVLCQDCLAIAEYTDTRHRGEKRCSCGGDWCGCGSCDDDVQKLYGGMTTKDEMRALWHEEGPTLMHGSSVCLG